MFELEVYLIFTDIQSKINKNKNKIKYLIILDLDQEADFSAVISSQNFRE